MQTGELISLIQGLGEANPIIVTAAGAGQDQANFGMYLMSLLSLESLPVDGQTAGGMAPEAADPAIVSGDNAGSIDLLLTALLSHERAIPANIIGRILPQEIPEQLSGELIPYIAQPLKSASVECVESVEPGTLQPTAGDAQYLTDELSTLLMQMEPAETTIAATTYAGSAIEASPQEVPVPNEPLPSKPMIESVFYNPINVDLPVVDDGDGMLVPLETPAESLIDSRKPVNQLPVPDEEIVANIAAAPIIQPAGLPIIQDNKSCTPAAPAVESATNESIVQLINRGNTLRPVAFTAAETTDNAGVRMFDSIPKSMTLSSSLPGTVLAGSVAEKTLVEDAIAPFPNAEIEALTVPAEKPAQRNGDSTATTEVKAAVRASFVTTPLIAAVDRQGSKEKQQTFAELSSQFAKVSLPAVPQEDAAVAETPELLPEVKIKPETVPAKTNSDIEPAAASTGSSTAVASKTDFPRGAAEDIQRTQFVIEPETTRLPIKVPAEIRLRLIPESLGLMKVTIRAMDDHLSARVVVQSQTAQTVVEKNLAELQRTLTSAGLVIDKFEVTVGHMAGSSSVNADADAEKRRYAYRQKANRRYQEAAGIKKSAAVDSVASRGGSTSFGLGTLNMMA